MIAQYRRLKAQHPDALLFFRMGDFYELFFEDAVVASSCLDIALTRRGRYCGQDIPMCGVPVHSAESYLHRLIRAGHRVAICEQLENPAEARRRGGSRALLARDVVRIVTPGTLTESALLDSHRRNYLAALASSRQRFGLAWVEISTGAFHTECTGAEDLGEALARIDPSEILLTSELARELRGLEEWRSRFTLADELRYRGEHGERELCAHFGVATLDGFGRFEDAELAAAGALFDYLRITQKGVLPRLEPPRPVRADTLMRIDPATRRNLELLSNFAGAREGSLLGAVDRTVTAAGARLLADQLAAPLRDRARIEERLDRVEACVRDDDRRTRMRELLRGLPDMERALGRLALDRGGPRDLLAVGRGLETATALAALLEDAEPPLCALGQGLDALAALGRELRACLVDSPPPLAREGGFIREGADAELDRLRELRDQGRRHIAALEARYRDETGIPSLKIRHNNLLGYYIEITATHRARVPQHFVQRQSMANATRYTSEELLELERELNSAAERALGRELAIFAALRQRVLAEAPAIAAIARRLAEVDVAAALGERARAGGWVRPRLFADSRFLVRGGRHPVVEEALAARGERFVANDCELAEEARLWLLTGPNMAGKSTFLRQNALIAVLTQAGSFVPAEEAEIGLIDRLFSRVGAADDIARGRSTFMVEMVETAAILNQATAESFVILDEIGRGTATFDGLSLAWAVVEYLHDVIACRGLFATHYHELTALAGRLPRLAARTMRVREWRGEVVFLHEVVPGRADRSYGIHVARLAGLPPPVLRRAEQVLRKLEAGEARSAVAELAEDLPLFAAALAAPQNRRRSRVEEALERIDPDTLSPRAALDLLYELKRLLETPEEPGG